MPLRIATMDLTTDQVPGDVVVEAVVSDGAAATRETDELSGVDAVVTFAQTFNGYAWGGGPHVLAETVAPVEQAWVAGQSLPGSLDLLRASLFLWVRAHGHSLGHQVSADDAAWLNALLGAMRERLAP